MLTKQGLIPMHWNSQPLVITAIYHTQMISYFYARSLNGLLVYVPSVDTAIKARGEKNPLVRVILDVLHPVRVTVESLDVVLQVPRIP